MSIHKECGEPIKWLRRPEDMDKFLPPMEYLGEVYVVEEGAGIYRQAYKLHMCDPDKIIAWQDYQRRLAEAKGEEFLPMDAAREREREQIWELVRKVACPRCEAGVDEKCISLSTHKVKAGIKEETKNPHPERIEHALAWKEDHE